jgi:hypothetical protein
VSAAVTGWSTTAALAVKNSKRSDTQSIVIDDCSVDNFKS